MCYYITRAYWLLPSPLIHTSKKQRSAAGSLASLGLETSFSAAARSKAAFHTHHTLLAGNPSNENLRDRLTRILVAPYPKNTTSLPCIYITINCTTTNPDERNIQNPFPRFHDTVRSSPKMPYNTRRKSLSLPSLGIQLPNASRAHRPSITTKASPTTTETPQQPPTKKVKRSHTSNSPSPTSPSRPRSSTNNSSSAKVVSFADRPKSSGRVAYENTPPPSPGAYTDRKVDTDGINDDIVVGVIEQLEKTGNRPHLIKELAMVLSNISDAVSA